MGFDRGNDSGSLNQRVSGTLTGAAAREQPARRILIERSVSCVPGLAARFWSYLLGS